MPKVEAIEAGGQPRRGRGRRAMSSLAEINVVPLVDVMLVLLVIFMVTAPMLQRGLDVNLPVARRAPQITGERIFISVPLDYRKTRVVYIGSEPVRVEVLQERMRQEMQSATNKQVFLRGDGGVQLQELMDVMERLRAGGVERVGIVSRLPEER